MLHNHILILPIYDEHTRLQRHSRLVCVGSQHAHANVVMVPVVTHKTVQEIPSAGVLRNEDLIIELFLGSRYSFPGFPVPGKDQFQIRFPAPRLDGARFPVVRIGVHGESLVILSFLVKIELAGIVIKTKGVVPVVQVITLLGDYRCSHPGNGSVQSHLPNAVHQVNLHFIGTGSPVFVNGIVFSIFPACIHLNAVVHLDAHRNLAGIADKPYTALGNHLLAAPGQGELGGPAHHKVVLPVVGMVHLNKLRRHHLPSDIVHRCILQTIQKVLGAVGNGKNRSRRGLGLGRENPGVHLVGGKLNTENIASPLTGYFAHMVGSGLSSGIARIKVEIHPGYVILMVAVLTRFHAAHARLGRV